MEATDERAIAWLAGFYEGEGHITACLYTNTHYNPCRKIELKFSQSEGTQYSLLRAQKILVANGISTHKISSRTRRDKYDRKREDTLTIGKFKDIERTCLLMWDYLSPRRKGQIQEAFAIYCEEFQPTHTIGNTDSEILDLPLEDSWSLHG